eukprot:gene12730-12826_t
MDNVQPAHVNTAISASIAHASILQRKRHVPFLLYGILMFCFGITTYIGGVCLGAPRILLGLSQLIEVQRQIIWYSGVPIVFGIALSLIDLLLFFDTKRFRTPLRAAPVTDRGVTVALTAYNDEESIAAAVADFLSHPDVRRVIVVSNNSVDATFANAQAAGALTFNEMAPGYGRCVFRCLTEAAKFEDTDFVVLCEGDRTFRAADIDKLLAYAPHADIVNGTRTSELLREHATQLSTFMYYGNVFVGKLLEAKHLGRSTMSDVGTTYKLCRREVLKALLPLVNPAINLEFNAHLLDVALEHGALLIECPITFHPRVGISKGEASSVTSGYHDSRLTHDPKRTIVWGALWRYYFRHRISASDTVLDLGCGYGDFINSVKARRRIALDLWPGFKKYIAPGVETVVGPVTDLSSFADGSIDYAFASNLFEHITQADLAAVLAGLRNKLSPKGCITMLQPNYRYCASEYFDDYTHISVWSHISLADFLTANGFDVTEVQPRFLPLTIKSRLPVWPQLIGAYLMVLRTTGLGVFAIMFVSLIWRFVVFLGFGVGALRWPFELDYGEGIVWQQANMILTPQAYGQIDKLPGIVFHYPPFYHLVTRGLSALAGLDMLVAGRAVSIGCLLLTSVFVGLIVARTMPAVISRPYRFLAGLGGALTIFCFVPVIFWSLLMRVDMLAFFLSVAGFWLGLKAFERPALVYAAALCFVAAVYTKQTSLAAPAALFALMLWLRPRLALVGIATCIVVGLIVLGLVSSITGGGFIRHVFLYNINRFEWSRLLLIGTVVEEHGMLFSVAVIALWLRLRNLRNRYTWQSARTIAENPADTAWLGAIFYLITTSLLLVTVAKSGSSANYLIEWLFVIAMLIGCALTDIMPIIMGADDRKIPDASFMLTVFFVPLAVAAHAWQIRAIDSSFDELWSVKRAAGLFQLSEKIGGTTLPIISDDMVILLRSGKQVVWEPAIFAELQIMGAWDQRPFIDHIRARDFAMFITTGKRGEKLFDGRYNSAVADAMDAAYPVQEKLGGYVLHLPARMESGGCLYGGYAALFFKCIERFSRENSVENADFWQVSRYGSKVFHNYWEAPFSPAIGAFLNHLAFGWYPYLVLAVFLPGSLIRLTREQYGWQSSVGFVLRRNQLMWGSNLFHVGILIIFIGHFFGLLTPIWIFDALRISHSFKQGLTIGIGGMASAMCFVGIILLAHRRFAEPDIRKTSSTSDFVMLLLVFSQLTLGLCTLPVSLVHIDGNEMVKFMSWAQGIAMLQPQAAELIVDVSPIFKIHILLGLTFFLVFPFTQLEHVWSIPVWLLGRRGYQVVRAGKKVPVRRACRFPPYQFDILSAAASTVNSGVLTPIAEHEFSDGIVMPISKMTIFQRLSAFRYNHDATAAVEFALVSLPFLMLLSFTFVMGFMLYCMATLDYATQTAARALLIGTVQSNSLTLDHNVIINLQTVTATPGSYYPFVNWTTGTLVVPPLDNTLTSFCPGGSSQYKLLQIVYPAPILFGWISSAANAVTYNGTKSFVMMSSAAFRNEPFPASSYVATSGVAAIEFAYIAPFLLACIWGCFETSKYITATRRISYLASSIAGEISENVSGTVSDNDLNFLYQSSLMIFPNEINDANRTGLQWYQSMQIAMTGIQFAASPTGCTTSCTYTPTVVWVGGNIQRSCTAPITQVSDASTPSLTTLPLDVYGPNFLVVVDIVYNYTPYLSTVFFKQKTLKKSFYINPRYVSMIKYTAPSGPFSLPQQAVQAISAASSYAEIVRHRIYAYVERQGVGLSRQVSRLARDRAGNVALITALCLVPLVGMTGLAVDYSVALTAKSRLDAAADAAAIAAITKAQTYLASYGLVSSANTVAIQQGKAQALKVFAANVGSLPFGTVPVPTVTLARVGQTLTASVSYKASIANQFGGIFKINMMNLSNTVGSSLTLGTFVNFYMMIDVSGSMGLPSTTAGQLQLAAINPDNKSTYPSGCQFACHFPGSQGYTLARSNSIQLRADAVGNAACVLFQSAQQTATLTNQFGIGVYPFITTLGTFFPLSTNMSAGMNAISGGTSGTCTTNQASTVIGSLLDTGSSPYGSGGTHFENAFPVLNNIITTVGDGSSISSPAAFVFLVTDGAENTQYYSNGNWSGGSNPQVMDPTVCSAMKQRGITVAVLYTPYQPIANPNYSFAGNEDGKVNAIIPNIPAQLQSCATSVNWLFTANTPNDINNAIAQMFTQAAQNGALCAVVIDTRALLDALPVAVYTTNTAGIVDFYNEAAASLWGQRPDLDDYMSLSNWRMFWPDGRAFPYNCSPLELAYPKNEIEAVIKRPDGLVLPILIQPKGLKNAAGKLIGSMNLMTDISDRKTAELKSAYLAAIVEDSEDAIISKTLDGRITSWNAGAARIFGYQPHEVIGQNIALIIPPELEHDEQQIIQRLQNGHRIESFDTVRLGKDGKRIDVSLTVSPLRNGLGEVIGASKVARDITESKKVQEILRVNEERFQLLAKATKDVIWDWDIVSGKIWWNEGLLLILGYEARREMAEMEFWMQNIAPADRDRAKQSIYAAIDGSALNWSCEYKFKKADGSMASIADRGFIIRDRSGAAVRMIGSMVDITERLDLDARLRQSQKLEAVGQLTGGVAHDFNNLLTVILGNAEVLSQNLQSDPQLQQLAEMTVTAAERAAELTKRLIAFARRQALEPKVIDLNRLVAGMDGLIRRTLAEDIDIEIVRAGGLWRALVDPSQLEIAVLNLAINARDAMPDGGRLTFETANVLLDCKYADMHEEVNPGQYVMLSVSDTGTGMEPEVIARAFEPFFTTKDIGKGSGLGLSMVYGFVKQSRGHVKIYSEIGQGTAIKIYVPRADTDVDAVNWQTETIPAPRGAEKILIVEDDLMVREHVSRQLVSLGYEVVSARNGPEALQILNQIHDFDLLFTDVVMPGGLNGRQLAEQVQKIYPNLPVLFTSGYTENAIIHHGRLDRGVHLLSKPYRKQELATKIRLVLDTAARYCDHLIYEQIVNGIFTEFAVSSNGYSAQFNTEQSSEQKGNSQIASVEFEKEKARLDLAKYIADMTKELSGMARRGDLPTLASLLALTSIEARNAVTLDKNGEIMLAN